MTDREVMRLALEALQINLPIAYAKNGRGERFPCFSDDPLREIKTREAITLLRQALDHVPDTTKMIEPDMGIDRGAWDDVPDATKWVDELRGGDEPEQEPVAWLATNNERGGISCLVFKYSEAVQFGDQIESLYTAPPKREFIGLTDEERYLNDARSEEDIEYARAIEAKLKEKNT